MMSEGVAAKVVVDVPSAPGDERLGTTLNYARSNFWNMKRPKPNEPDNALG